MDREDAVERYDFAIVGAGPAGEAAAFKARELGATVAIADRRWFGGSCPFIGCIPSKALLHSAARHHDDPGGYDWRRASERRDYMIERPADAEEPDDRGHRQRLADAGATVLPGSGRIVARGRLEVEHDGATHEVEAREIVIAVGSTSKIPRLEGIEAVHVWTNREATFTRELPRSLLVLGGGPTACELAQVYVRFGVSTTIVQSRPVLMPTDHRRNGETVRAALERDGVTVRTGARAMRVRAGGGRDGAHLVELDDGSTVEGHAILAAVGRSFPLEGLGLEEYGLDGSAPSPFARDGRLRVADGLLVIGDPAGPELHTHQAHYQGELAVRLALGEAVVPDYRALPRATYTDPEAASVGMSLEEAQAAGVDAFDEVAEFAKTAKGYSVEAELGHVTIVVDRGTRQLVGAAMACPDASAAIHECVLAIKARVPMDVLADTIHAFPSTSRILNGLFASAAKRLSEPTGRAAQG